MVGSKSPSAQRFEFFSDGVLAIVMTIMAIELKLPRLEAGLTSSWDFSFLAPELPKLLSYALGFFIVSTTWVSQVLLTRALEKTNMRLLAVNLFWLFLVSLVPAVTAFIGDYPSRPMAVMIWSAVTGAVLLWGDLAVLFAAQSAGLEVQDWGIRRSIWVLVTVLLAIAATFVWPLASWILIAIAYGLHWIPVRHAARFFGPKVQVGLPANVAQKDSAPIAPAKSRKAQQRSRKNVRR